MILYISGPMTGLPGLNSPAFFEAEERLLEIGYTVINPAKNPIGLKYENYMDIAMAQIRACDGVFILKDYNDSPGAKAEVAYASALKKMLFGCDFDMIKFEKVLV